MFQVEPAAKVSKPLKVLTPVVDVKVKLPLAPPPIFVVPETEIFEAPTETDEALSILRVDITKSPVEPVKAHPPETISPPLKVCVAVEAE